MWISFCFKLESLGFRRGLGMVRVGLSDILLVLIGGGVGAIARWLLSLFVQEKIGSVFPLGTLLVNVLGSLLLGFVMGASLFYGGFSHEERLFLATGFAGGFTTFSTFSYETLSLLETEHLLALIYVGANLLGGLIAVWGGMVIAKLLYR